MTATTSMECSYCKVILSDAESAGDGKVCETCARRKLEDAESDQRRAATRSDELRATIARIEAGETEVYI